MSVCTQASVGAVWVHFVSGSAGADEAGAAQVGALLLTQVLLTVAIVAKVWSQTKASAFQTASHHFKLNQ